MYTTAKQATDARLAEVKKLLAEIEAAADKTAKEFADKGGTDWSYAGSFGYAQARLVEIRDFLVGEG
jgi:hypothetical protein